MSCGGGSLTGNRKYQKTSEPDNEDRISNLPDEIISQILSCLPTKKAVQTCVLSSDWEYKWTSAYKFDIDESRNRNGFFDEVSFIRYVDRILHLSPNIKTFKFSFHKFRNANRLATWISALFRRDIENISLAYPHCSESDPPDAIILPRALLHCTSLRELTLLFYYTICTFKVPHEIFYPNLTKLHLEAVRIMNDNSTTNTLVFHFPVLEMLQLSTCSWIDAILAQYHAPSLSNFSFRSNGEGYDFIIKIIGATLKEFNYTGLFQENFLFTGSTVECATLMTFEELDDDFSIEDALRVRRLLSQLPSLRRLTFHDQAAELIAYGSAASHPQLRMFNQLGELELIGHTWCDIPDHTEFLVELLHAVPFLKYLCIVMQSDPSYSLDMDRNDSNDVVLNEQDDYEEVEDGYDYNAVESIPSCIVSHLKKVEFIGYCGDPHQFNLARFLLKNGSQLKELRFEGGTSWMKIAKLLAFPRASGSVKFVVTPK